MSSKKGALITFKKYSTVWRDLKISKGKTWHVPDPFPLKVTFSFFLTIVTSSGPKLYVFKTNNLNILLNITKNSPNMKRDKWMIPKTAPNCVAVAPFLRASMG